MRSPSPACQNLWRPGSQVMAQCKLGRPQWGATARFREVAAKILHYPTRIWRRLHAGSNFLSNSALEPRSTGYVESLIRPQAEAAADDLLHDLDGRRIGMSRQHAAVMQSAGAGLLDPPQSVRRRGRGGFPHKNPTDETGLCGTRRHGC